MKNIKFEEPKFVETEFESVAYACCDSNNSIGHVCDFNIPCGNSGNYKCVCGKVMHKK